MGTNPKLYRLLTFALVAPLAIGPVASAQAPKKAASPPTFEDLLAKISRAPADSCRAWGEDFSNIESKLFEAEERRVEQRLNDTSRTASDGAIVEDGASGVHPTTSNARLRAIAALEDLEHLSAKVNKTWPKEERFHFQVLEIPPLLLVKTTIRNRATFSVFAIPQLDPYNKPTNKWQAMGAEDNHRLQPDGGYDALDLFPLERGPGQRARFLARFVSQGCGVVLAVAYFAYEWGPQNSGDLSEFIKLTRNDTQEEPVAHEQPSATERLDSFAPIGELQTRGPLITLPYCWFSEIDTWDNPSLCAVDTYDLSGDRVRFVRSDVNRPDLLPIARAIQYAQAHDYPAVLAYCESTDVAKQMIRDIPPYVFAGPEVRVARIDAGKERVEIGDQTTFQFEVEKRGDRWLVVSFQTED